MLRASILQEEPLQIEVLYLRFPRIPHQLNHVYGRNKSCGCRRVATHHPFRRLRRQPESRPVSEQSFWANTPPSATRRPPFTLAILTQKVGKKSKLLSILNLLPYSRIRAKLLVIFWSIVNLIQD
ncbi:Uncharacterized protein Adt_07188 [Abeliophyllum distichum]|uniref:Uncharacterized protein n=1 Tax=Abeliophyllum distichum TaxID=126358 RepID=A0ABD1V936_9LAMI